MLRWSMYSTTVPSGQRRKSIRRHLCAVTPRLFAYKRLLANHRV
jgi:hypothetical protein